MELPENSPVGLLDCHLNVLSVAIAACRAGFLSACTWCIFVTVKEQLVINTAHVAV